MVDYISHLQHLEEESPVLLLAYAYHMYMGLLSGGQILRRKRALLNKLKFRVKESYEGLAVTEITGVTIYHLKKQITDTTNNIADKLDQSTRDLLIKESKNVFEMNDKVVRSIEGTTSVMAWRLLQVTSVSLAVAVIAYFVKKVVF